MADMLRILMLEDHALDTELIERELRSAGFVFLSKRVETREAFLAEMAAFAPDIVLSDYSLPQFTGGEALALVREQFPETPFIIVTGSLTEEAAVDCLKNGAENYVIKEHLVRLAPAVRTALENKRNREEKRTAERAIRMAAIEWRTTFDAISDAVCLLDAEGRVIRCNEAMQAMTGKPWSEIIGKPCHTVTHGASEPISDGPRLRMLESGRKEVTLCESDGRWFDIRVDPIRDENHCLVGAVQTVSDITERKRAEEALKLFRALVDQSSDAIEVLDPETGCFLDVNERGCLDLGYAREEFFALRVFDIDPMVSPSSFTKVVEELQKSGSLVWEGIHRRKDGSTFPVEVNLKYVRFDRDYMVAVARDITKHKQAEEERLKLEAQMQQTQKLESLGVLAGGIAHDFSNLLMGVIGNAELALKELPADLPGCVRIREIQVEARRATELCRQLLAYSGKGRFVIEPMNLNAVVKEMGQMLEVSISKKAVLRYRFAEHLPAIEADPTQIRQIIMNLVINASDAVGDKSGYISIATGVRQCDCSFLDGASLGESLPEGSYVFIEVSDTGVGMSLETKARIFEPFFTTKFTGRGLGLAAALGIIKGHKGAITVASELGKGTTFTVLFPASSQPVAVAPAKAAAKGKTGWKGSGTILIVDDERNIRNISKIHLEGAGFSVITAENGRKGLQLFRERMDDIVLVLLDLTMPEMSGEEVYQAIVRLKPDARIVLSSGYSEHEIISHFAGQGLAGFIQKPYESAALLAVVRRAIEG